MRKIRFNIHSFVIFMVQSVRETAGCEYENLRGAEGNDDARFAQSVADLYQILAELRMELKGSGKKCFLSREWFIRNPFRLKTITDSKLLLVVRGIQDLVGKYAGMDELIAVLDGLKRDLDLIKSDDLMVDSVCNDVNFDVVACIANMARQISKLEARVDGLNSCRLVLEEERRVFEYDNRRLNLRNYRLEQENKGLKRKLASHAAGYDEAVEAYGLTLLEGPLSLLGLTCEEVSQVFDENSGDVSATVKILRKRSVSRIHPDKFSCLVAQISDPALKEQVELLVVRRTQQGPMALSELKDQLERAGTVENKWVYNRLS
ncbi:MAG: hypothetical protein ABIH78_02175 [Candidatus Peregrinibacteria bacterium]